MYDAGREKDLAFAFGGSWKACLSFILALSFVWLQSMC